MSRIISGIAAAIVAVVLPFSFAPSAEARVVDQVKVQTAESPNRTTCHFGFCFVGTMYHHDPDHGYDRPILFACNKSSTGWRKLYEGHTTDEYCDPDGNGIADFDKFKLRPKEKLVSWRPLRGWKTKAVGPGVFYVEDGYYSDSALKLK